MANLFNLDLTPETEIPVNLTEVAQNDVADFINLD